MIPSDLRDAIEAKDKNLVKAIILLQINSDRKQETPVSLFLADHADQELANIGMSLYQENNKETHYLDDRSQWSKELWENLRIDFEYNFSRFKLEQISEVMAYLRKQSDPYFQVDETFNNEQNALSKSIVNDLIKQESDSRSQSNIGSHYVIGGIAGAVLGGVGGKMLGFGVVGIALGAVAGLAAVYLKSKKD